MVSNDLFKKIRKIEIKTRGLSNHIFSGQYHSVFKGKGMAFSEVREYFYGDDVRNIDWNVTARYNHPFVKVFEEERELTVMLLIDVSASSLFGTHKQFKNELITEIAAVLSFSAIQNNDKVGVIFFSNKIEKFIPPKKGRTHILRIISELLQVQPEDKQTDIGEALRYFSNMIKKRCTVFIFSDFLDSNDFGDSLKITSRKHDLISVQISDPAEMKLHNVGLLKIKDMETGKYFWIDTSQKNTRKHFAQYQHEHQQRLQSLMTKNGIDLLQIETGQDYVKPLMGLFKRREK